MKLIEIWRDVIGYEGIYEVSSFGVIRWKRGGARRKGKTIKQHTDTQGYGIIVLRKDCKPKTHSAHRIIAKAFIENPENKPQVNHINGVKNDNRVENLEWATQTENTIHAVKMGLINYENVTGEKCHTNKLSEDDVIEIRKCYAEKKVKHRIIAQQYGVCTSSIQAILQRRNWRHI